ncbi:helix-turn-helix transcriptional regulator [soil metagenome]
MEISPIGEYLRARREQVRPEDVGIVWSGVRRVAGLRREEVAALAGISAEYYLRLEQGRDRQPSDQVLKALSRALRLDVAASLHLHRLAHPDSPLQLVRAVDVVDPHLIQLLEQWPTTPAVVVNACRDVLAVNPITAALESRFLRVGNNLVRNVFTPGLKEMSPDWEELAAGAVAALRMTARPDDPRLIEIVGELSVSDPDFRRLWARHDVHPSSSGTSLTHVPGFGVVPVRWQNLDVLGSNGQMIIVFFGEPGSVGEQALRAVSTRLVPSPR